MMSRVRMQMIYGRTVQVTISIPMLLLQKIDDLAEKLDTSRSHIASALIIQGISKYKSLTAEEIEEV